MVARARAAGVRRMVTICTRVRKFPQVLAVAEKFPEVFCSVGTHPHNAHEELDIDAKALIALTKNPKVVAIGEAGLDYHYDNSPRDAQAQSLRQHIAAARETGLPLVIHARDCDADMARILQDESGKGAFPAVLHCFTGGRDLAFKAIELGHYVSFHRHPHLQEFAKPARHRRGIAGRPHSGRDRRAVSRAAAVSRQTQ